MKMKIYFFCVIVFAAAYLISCGSLGMKFGMAGSGADMQKEFSLANNMKVIVVENPQSKTVALDMWVNTGSKDEPQEISGVSHFLEHMLFKGTDTRKPGEIDEIIEGVGGVWNAGTSNDFTHFYLTVPAEKFSVGLDVLSDVIMNSSLDAEELERERLVILEEYRRKQDNPGGLLYEAIFTKSYKAGGYERTVLGTPETIKAITREKMMAYYHERYIPKNMVFVISGNVKADDIKPGLEDTFKNFSRGADFVIPASGEVIQTFGSKTEIKKQVNETYYAMIFPAPGIENIKDDIAMDMLSSILGNGRSSRLYLDLKERKQLVSSISANYPTMKGKSLFMVIATCKYDKTEEVKKAVLEEMQKVASGNISNEEFAKSKKMLRNSNLFGKETNEGKTSTIGYYYTLTSSSQYEKDYLSLLDKVSKEDIKRLAANINEKNMNIVLVAPEDK